MELHKILAAAFIMSLLFVIRSKGFVSHKNESCYR